MRMVQEGKELEFKITPGQFFSEQRQTGLWSLRLACGDGSLRSSKHRAQGCAFRGRALFQSLSGGARRQVSSVGSA